MHHKFLLCAHTFVMKYCNEPVHYEKTGTFGKIGRHIMKKKRVHNKKWVPITSKVPRNPKQEPPLIPNMILCQFMHALIGVLIALQWKCSHLQNSPHVCGKGVNEKCDVCGKGINEKCDVCGKGVNEKCDVCGKGVNEKCDVCGKGVNEKCDVCGKGINEKCDVCGKGINEKCDVCGKGINEKSQLCRHLIVYAGGNL